MYLLKYHDNYSFLKEIKIKSLNKADKYNQNKFKSW